MLKTRYFIFDSKKNGYFIFLFIISIHILAMVLPIRYWPLTDYPMFRKTAQPFETISRLTLETVIDNKIIPWKRWEYGAGGTGDNGLQKYINNPFDPDFDVFLEQALKKLSQSGHATSIRVIKKSYQLNEHGFTEKTEVLREFSTNVD
jgi:hypothetical protein